MMRNAFMKIQQSATHPLLLRLVSLAVGLTFIYASLDKIHFPDRFADIVHDYQMLPVLAINAFALVLPWTELVAGLALIAGIWRRAAGLVATALTISFLIAIAWAEYHHLRIECGCFDVSGVTSSEASWSLFLRDIPLLLGSVLVWRKGI